MGFHMLSQLHWRVKPTDLGHVKNPTHQSIPAGIPKDMGHTAALCFSRLFDRRDLWADGYTHDIPWLLLTSRHPKQQQTPLDSATGSQTPKPPKKYQKYSKNTKNTKNCKIPLRISDLIIVYIIFLEALRLVDPRHPTCAQGIVFQVNWELNVGKSWQIQMVGKSIGNPPFAIGNPPFNGNL